MCSSNGPPLEFDEIIERYTFLEQAWHWHKRHMIQFDLNAAIVPRSVATSLIDRSYSYVLSRLPRKLRATLLP